MCSSPSTAPNARVTWGCAALIVVAVSLAWSNALSAPFVLDDHGSVVGNASIQTLWPPGWLTPPATGGETVSGRPVLNFSFALNHALHGLDVRGYHATNIALHACAALFVFGILRRTFALLRERAPVLVGGALRPDSATGRDQRAPSRGVKPLPPFKPVDQTRRSETWCALALALLWALHPLQTAAVTYVAQRAETLAGLFYLLAVYGFLRAAGEANAGRVSDPPLPGAEGQVGDPPCPRTSLRAGWAAVSVAACLLGVGTKETLVTAPLVILLFDRALLAGSFRAAWRARGWLHAALFATWVPLAVLVFANRGRGGSAGFAAEIDAGAYLLTQAGAIVRYLALVCWPAGQVFDYGVALAPGFGAVWPQLLGLSALALATGWTLRRNRLTGFLGACFFLWLAPSSSVVPVATQTIAEHRIYLALLVPVAFAVMGAAWLARRAKAPWAAGVAAAAVALALGAATFARNEVYRTELALWQDTVAKRPENPRARHNLGLALAAAGRMDEAIAAFRAAIALRPEHAFARYSLGVLLLEQQQPAEAATQFEAALAAQPDYPEAQASLGEAFVQLDRLDAAERQLRGVKLPEDAAGSLRAVLTAAFVELGNRRARQRNYAQAMTAYEDALALDPSQVIARANLANCLLVTGRPREAIEHYEAVLRARPADEAVRRNLEIAREGLGGGR